MNISKTANINIDKYLFYIMSFILSISLILSYIWYYYKFHTLNLLLMLFETIIILLLYFFEYLYRKNNSEFINILKYISFIILSIFIYFYKNPSIYLIMILILIIYIIIYEKNTYLTKILFAVTLLSFYITYIISKTPIITYLIYLTIYLVIFFFLYHYKKNYLKRIIYLKNIEHKNKIEIVKKQKNNISVRKMRRIIISNIEEIAKSFEYEYFSYQTSTYLKNIFFENNFENEDLHFRIDITNIEEVIEEVIDEYRKYYILNVTLESTLDKEKYVVTDREKFKNLIRLIFDFGKENNIKIKLSVSGSDIKSEFIFDDIILNYIHNKTIAEIQKQTLWIRILVIIAKITGNTYKRDTNSLILTLKKI